MNIRNQKSNAMAFGEEVSQTEFARILGISRSHLCDIERGRKAVRPVRAEELRRAA